MASRWYQPVRYTPVDPGAYIARQDWRSNLLVFAMMLVGAGVFLFVALRAGSIFFGLVALLAVAAACFRARNIRAGAVALAVDAPGVFFGESSSLADNREQSLVPWAAISSVVLCEVRQQTTNTLQSRWVPAIGVRLDPGYLRQLRDQRAEVTARRPLTPEQRQVLDQVLPVDSQRNDVSAFRVIAGWRLDRAGLEEAVRRFAPSVTVEDSGRQDGPQPSVRDVIRLLRTLRSTAGDDPPRGAR